MTTTHDAATTLPTEGFTELWREWHSERVDAARAAYGLASVTGTHWLTTDPTAYPGAPGRWSVRGDTAIGTDIDDTALELSVGSAVRVGELEIRVIARGGATAIRVLDPGAATRADLAGIDAYRPDPAWVLDGRFTPAEAGATIEVEHVDGAVTSDPLAGWVEVSLGGAAHSLAAFPASGGALQISFGDATNGTETARFRFLALPAPDADGHVSVDLNRAYLPPSTFTDHYLCPLPPADNRIPVAVRAGEKVPALGAPSPL